MYLVVLVGNFVRQDVREWFPSTTGPLLPTMTDSLLAPGRGVLYKVRHKGCHFCWTFCPPTDALIAPMPCLDTPSSGSCSSWHLQHVGDRNDCCGS